MKNLVLAGYSGYTTKDKVFNFVESFNKVKLSFDELVILYAGKRTEINDYLDSVGVKQVSVKEKSFSPYVNRFYWYADFLKNTVYEKVVCADIRDVVFQSNPFTWMNTYQINDLIVCDEGFKHNEEAWNSMTMQGAFPDEAHKMRNKNVFNVGVFGGNALEVQWICEQITKKCEQVKVWVHNYKGKLIEVVPDQVAFSILLDTIADSRVTQRCDNTDNWCLTIASVCFSTFEYQGIDGKICNPDGMEYCLIHQYDRQTEFLKYHVDTNSFSADGKKFFKVKLQDRKNLSLEQQGTVKGEISASDEPMPIGEFYD